MAAKPPLLPEETLRRVDRLASLDGMSILIISAAFALFAAYDHDVTGALIGVAAAGAGTLELQGLGIMRNGGVRGINWMIASQLLLLAVILGNAYFHLTHFDADGVKALLKALLLDGSTSDEILQLKQSIAAQGMSTNDAMKLYNAVLWGSISIVTLIYQGGMAIYYRRRRDAVAAALLDEI